MSADVLEASLEAHFRQVVRESGGMAFKLAPIEAGFPDRMAVFPGGRLFLVELKRDSTDLRPAQRVMHAKLADRGTTVLVLHGRREIDDWITSLSR